MQIPNILLCFAALSRSTCAIIAAFARFVKQIFEKSCTFFLQAAIQTYFRAIQRSRRLTGQKQFLLYSLVAFSARSWPYNKVYLIFYLLIKEDAL